MKTILQNLEKTFIYFVLYTLIAVISYILIATFLQSLSAQSQLTLNIYAITEVTKKTTTLILISFLIVLIGTMVVLKGVESSYHLTVTTDKVKSSLETTSPGLVMITLGCALLAFSINKTFTISTTPATAGAQTVTFEKPIAVVDTTVSLPAKPAGDKPATYPKKASIKKPVLPGPTQDIAEPAKVTEAMTVAGASGPPPLFKLADIALLTQRSDKKEFNWAYNMQNKIFNQHYKATPEEWERYSTLGWKINALKQ